MAKKSLHITHRLLGMSTIALGLLSVTVVATVKTDRLDAYLVAQPKETPWIVISESQVESGAVIPPNTNTVFHLPQSFNKISREVLLGQKGKQTRYWGYCFPANYDPTLVDKRDGFPGLIFLSEKERAVRAAEEAKPKMAFSIFNLPTELQVKALSTQHDPRIHHQLDSFSPGTMCYVMSEAPLAIGLDPDGDRLNSELERELGTNPQTPDSEGDGILDGIEYMTGTLPTIRDTDDDGIIDGIEDTNWNGRIDPGETDPRNRDTDRDGLCDGLCRVRVQRQYIYIGEDKNFNGEVDSGETDPNMIDTDGDGYSDEVEYMRCLADGNTTCPND